MRIDEIDHVNLRVTMYVQRNVCVCDLWCFARHGNADHC